MDIRADSILFFLGVTVARAFLALLVPRFTFFHLFSIFLNPFL
jgi:hypothetical protein